MDKNLYTAIDASLNRGLEGIRVCEDIVRFTLHDSDLSKKLKQVRHACVRAASQLDVMKLLRGRNVPEDPLKFHDLPDEKRRDSLPGLFRVNLHRATEAVRSLEEMVKLLPQGDSASFQEVRFTLYEIEKVYFSTYRKARYLERFDGALYAILDASGKQEEQCAQTVKMLIAGGAAIIELQMRTDSKGRIYRIAEEASLLCRKSDVLFIVNEQADIAELVGAAGVSLGEESLPLSQVRRLIADEMLIGFSVESPGRISEVVAGGADFLIVRPVHETMPDADVLVENVALETVKEICAQASCPVVCTGDVTPNNIPDIKKTGCNSFAVQSFLYKDDQIVDNCRKIMMTIAGE